MPLTPAEQDDWFKRSGLTQAKLGEGSDYNDGRLRGRMKTAFQEFIPEVRTAIIAVYQGEVGLNPDGKFGPATERRAEQDRDAYIANPNQSSWGSEWDRWIDFDDQTLPPARGNPPPATSGNTDGGNTGGGSEAPADDDQSEGKPDDTKTTKKKGFPWGKALLGFVVVGGIAAMVSGDDDEDDDKKAA